MAAGRSGGFKQTEKLVRFPRSLKAIAFGMALFCCASVSRLSAQSSTAGIEQSDSLRGMVVNSVTHEPVSRVLVFSSDNRFATMTDDRGHFKFKFPETESEQTAGLADSSGNLSMQTSGFRRVGTNRPGMLMARKTGFLSPNDGQGGAPIGPEQQEVTITLVPEALVIGQVILPGSDGSDRIQIELYRRQVREGREHWDSAGSVMSRSNSEFRFAQLYGGAYKLFTHELLDRDPLTFNPRGQLFGYPPVYYPAAPDFATAAVIQLAPGSTFQANISPAKREYYPVKVSVTNAPAGVGYGVQVWPQGHPGPGYSLSYNVEDELIEGLLPNGTYTVQLATYGPPNATTGMLNFAVGGPTVSGPAVSMLPNSSIAVSVKEEFQNTQITPQLTTITTQSNTFETSQRRPNYLGVTLLPDEEFGSTQAASLRPPTGPEDESLVIENAQPGRYRVSINTSIGYASSITSGGTDLLRKPLVVRVGGTTPPIEITVRDDGAEIEGTVERTSTSRFSGAGIDSPGQSPGIVYFVPTADGSGQFRLTWVSPDGKFQLQQLPPGVYRVLAFDRQQPELEYESDAVMKQYDSATQIIRVVAGQKEHLRLSVIAARE